MLQTTTSESRSSVETTRPSVEDRINRQQLDLEAIIRKKYPPQQDESPLDVLKNIREQMEGMRGDTNRNEKIMRNVVIALNQIRMNQRIMMKKIDDVTTKKISDETYNMTPDEIRDLMVEKVELDKPFYPSDIASEYGLDYDMVLKAIDILRREGRIIDRS